MFDPVKLRQAKLNVLHSMMQNPMTPPSVPQGVPTAGAVEPVGPLAALKEKQEAEMRTMPPLSSSKGLKESMTKKIKPKM